MSTDDSANQPCDAFECRCSDCRHDAAAVCLCPGQTADRHLAGRLAGRLGHDRRRGAADRYQRRTGENELKGMQRAIEHINSGDR
jgi:hypothetical protein